LILRAILVSTLETTRLPKRLAHGPELAPHEANWRDLGLAAADLDFARHLADVERVQAGQLPVARFLVGRFGLAGVYQEGLAAAALPDWTLRLGLLRDLDELDRLGGLDDEARQRWRSLLLEVGVAGRLQLEGSVREVRPLDDEAARNEAKPVADGTGVIDAGCRRDREQAMVRTLPRAGVALVIRPTNRRSCRAGAATDPGDRLSPAAGTPMLQGPQSPPRGLLLAQRNGPAPAARLR
jgi:hypothetical protein